MRLSSHPGRFVISAEEFAPATNYVPLVGYNNLLPFVSLFIGNIAVIARHPFAFPRPDPYDRSSAFLAMVHVLFLPSHLGIIVPGVRNFYF